MALNADDPALGDPGAAAGGPEPQWDPKTRAYIENLRREAAGFRTENKALKSQQNTELRAARLYLALTRAAHAQGVDVDFATFLLSKSGWLAAQDPNSEAFGEALRDRLDSLVAENPQLRSTSTQVPTTSGVPGRGPAAVSTQLTRQQVADISKRQGPEAVKELLERGDLNQLLGRR